MGHGFGLGHTCYPGASASDHTDIMSSPYDCDSAAGLRDIGFNDEQLAIILTNAELTAAALAQP